jgi:putative ribosome biogenesis GTPase RsgA
VSFENAFLERFLIYVYAKAVKTVLAIIVSDHLPSECSLFFLRMIDDPNATYVDLLAEIVAILNRHQFFYVTDSEIVFEL